MKFTLNDYQADAVTLLLEQLKSAKSFYHRPENAKETSIALTAPTGAGKTVMAAAAIEALFFGNDRFAFEGDPSAVVIWFSDSPSLNDQSRFRLMQASEKLTFSNLIDVKSPFPFESLDAGKVYFMNTQRLSRTALLTRGYEPPNPDDALEWATAMPDDQAFTIWDTISNTIEDPGKTLYLLLDEAHRGFDKKVSSERQTIVRRLVSGEDLIMPMPVVLGISATPGRFKEAMSLADRRADRLALPEVEVEARRVQESGLIKDSIVLDIPENPSEGDLTTTLAGEAAKRLTRSTREWRKYSSAEKLASPVVPLMVFQIPNTPDKEMIGRCLDAMRAQIPDLVPSQIRHVLNENTMQDFGGWQVLPIAAQRVQDTDHVRILVAKEAISTGWDCPRAEVLFSLRPAKDQTHIAQLLGRMVRNPLARRIPGNDALNAVDCILPYFERSTAGKIVQYITGAIDGLPPIGGGRVLLNGKELSRNEAIPEQVWQAYEAMPTETVPQLGVRPVKRLLSLAQALSADGIHTDAIREVTKKIFATFDTCSKTFAELIDDARKEVIKVHVQTLSGKQGGGQISYTSRVVKADSLAIRSALNESKRAFGSDIVDNYINHLADESPENSLESHCIAAASLGFVKEVREQVDRESTELARQWFEIYTSRILGLSDQRQLDYELVRAMATEPQKSQLRKPVTRLEDFSIDENGVLFDSPTVKFHLMTDSNGDYPIGNLNSWEQGVIEKELARSTFSAWYRNPAHNGVDSLTVAYQDELGNWRSLHPDFVFFNEVEGRILPSIVDPHGLQLQDSLVKLVGLAKFAEKYGQSFERIEAVAMYGNVWKKLDMKSEVTRNLIHSHSGSVEILYKNASNYS